MDLVLFHILGISASYNALFLLHRSSIFPESFLIRLGANLTMFTLFLDRLELEVEQIYFLNDLFIPLPILLGLELVFDNAGQVTSRREWNYINFQNWL